MEIITSIFGFKWNSYWPLTLNTFYWWLSRKYEFVECLPNQRHSVWIWGMWFDCLNSTEAALNFQGEGPLLVSCSCPLMLHGADDRPIVSRRWPIWVGFSVGESGSRGVPFIWLVRPHFTSYLYLNNGMSLLIWASIYMPSPWEFQSRPIFCFDKNETDKAGSDVLIFIVIPYQIRGSSMYIRRKSL